MEGTEWHKAHCHLCAGNAHISPCANLNLWCLNWCLSLLLWRFLMNICQLRLSMTKTKHCLLVPLPLLSVLAVNLLPTDFWLVGIEWWPLDIRCHKCTFSNLPFVICEGSNSRRFWSYREKHSVAWGFVHIAPSCLAICSVVYFWWPARSLLGFRHL